MIMGIIYICIWVEIFLLFINFVNVLKENEYYKFFNGEVIFIVIKWRVWWV